MTSKSELSTENGSRIYCGNLYKLAYVMYRMNTILLLEVQIIHRNQKNFQKVESNEDLDMVNSRTSEYFNKVNCNM